MRDENSEVISHNPIISGKIEGGRKRRNEYMQSYRETHPRGKRKRKRPISFGRTNIDLTQITDKDFDFAEKIMKADEKKIDKVLCSFKKK